MKKHRILLQTNPVWYKTGLAENAKTLLKHLHKTGKYEIAHYCTQISVADGNLNLTPWKSYGSLPNDPQSIQRLNSDPNKARSAAYGAWNIDSVIKDFKPTIWIGSDDCWGFSKSDYIDKPWYKKINSILHITLDSLPILEQAFEQAENTEHYLTWAKFAKREMHKLGNGKFNHVDQIYGSMDTNLFSPISDDEKSKIRKQFNIDENTTIFLFVFRNQLRKSANLCLEAFAKFKKENPTIKAKLHFHTSFSEKGSGWDIPKMAGYYGVSLDDILCTYICKKCNSWFISPYRGEDLNCPICKEEKSLITVNINNGVPAHMMRYIYGVSDACLSIFTSGGQEYHSVQSLLCGKPLACTNYSCGEDFCDNDFVTPIKFHTYHEAGTNFIKAANNVNQIEAFIRKIYKMPKSQKNEIGAKGRKWAIDNFSIEVIGKKWEALFDSLPLKELNDFDFKTQQKNQNFAYPENLSDLDFVQALYSNILLMNENPESDGVKHWMDKIKNGLDRKEVYNFFIKTAQEENQKNNGHQEFSSILDYNGKKRGLFLIKESIGDIIISTALFESFHEQHPDTDLYVACDMQYADILKGNPYIHKVIPYIPQMEQEMAFIGVGSNQCYFDYYYHVAMQTQRVLSYLSQPEPAFSLE